MKEIWKKIDIYENIIVSNYGNVKLKERTYVNCNGVKSTHKEKLLKQNQTGKGYKINKGYLAVSTVYGSLKVHKLVALAFLENKNNYSQINHIDGNSLNNKVENLEWCTNIENQHHSKRNRDFFTSKYVGVRYRKDRKCFSAELKFNNIRYRKSGFLNEESANEYLTNLKKQLCL